MLKDLNPTTRCYPRTLNEAWPMDNPQWWENPPPRDWKHKAYLWAGAAIWIVISFVYWRYL